MISKTRFQHGVHCPKHLWLDVHRRELAQPPDPATRLRLAEGHRVGRLARERYPGGVLVADSSARHARAAARTSLLLDDASVPALFEGAFEHDGLRVRADVVVRGPSGFDLVEVKSALSPRDEHVRDLAIQAFVLDGSGVELTSTRLLHMNPDYVWYGGPFDPQALFREADVTEAVFAMAGAIRTQLEEFRRLLAEPVAPGVAMGRHCIRPRRCAFFDPCRREASGTGAAETPRFEIDGSALPAVLEEPVAFLDVQTFSTALPRLAGARPHEQIPFVWSFHVRGGEGSPRTLQCLAEPGGVDPRAELADTLARVLPPRGSIVVFSQESGGLLSRAGEQAGAALERRIVDLKAALEAAAPLLADGWSWGDAVASLLGASARSASSSRRQAAADYLQAMEAPRLSERRRSLLDACRRYGSRCAADLEQLTTVMYGHVQAEP
jgi:hypothetical protein